MMIAHERRVLLEDVAGFRVLDVRLESDETVLAGLLEDLVEYLQQFRVGLGAVRIGLEQAQRLRRGTPSAPTADWR